MPDMNSDAAVRSTTASGIADSTPAVDWEARELVLQLVLCSKPTSGARGGKTLADWWDHILRQPRKFWVARLSHGGLTGRSFGESNMGKAIASIGIEPTLENYRPLVNAGRKRLMPRSKPL